AAPQDEDPCWSWAHGLFSATSKATQKRRQVYRKSLHLITDPPTLALRLQHKMLEIAVVHFLDKFSHESSSCMIASTMAFAMNPSAASSTHLPLHFSSTLLAYEARLYARCHRPQLSDHTNRNPSPSG